MKIGHVSQIFLLFSLYACGGNDGSNDDKSVFRYNESAGITSLDPAFARNPENINAVNHLFNSLVEIDSNMQIRPSIAESWEISEDGKVYTFHIRRNVRFHNHSAFPKGKGREVVATDFVYSFERLIDPETASPGVWIFSNVDRNQKTNLGFEAVDRYTLRIYLSKAFQPFLGLLTMKYCSVVPHEVVEESGANFRREPVGTGPFRFQTWSEGSKLVLLRNDNYFEKDARGRSLPYLDAVAITFIGDEEVEYLEFLKGNLDFLSGSDGSNMEFLDHEGRPKEKYRKHFRLRFLPYLNTEYLGILMDSTLPDMKHSPLNSEKVRKALSLGIDRQSMVKYLRNGIGHAAEEGFIPKGLPPYKNNWVKGYRYDPDSSRRLLKEAGFVPGENPVEVTISTTSQYLALCEYIVGQWTELGVEAKIEVNPAATSRELIALARLPFFRKSWVADYADAENYMALFYSKHFSPSGPNYTHYKNLTFDNLYERAVIELNDSIRDSYYMRMEKILIDDCPVIPLYYDEVVWYMQNSIEGISGNASNLIDIRRVRKIELY